jgi:hypothetical protein
MSDPPDKNVLHLSIVLCPSARFEAGKVELQILGVRCDLIPLGEGFDVY